MSDTYRAKCATTLLAKIYKGEGWVREAGESRSRRASQHFHMRICWKTGYIVATRLFSRPATNQETEE